MIVFSTLKIPLQIWQSNKYDTWHLWMWCQVKQGGLLDLCFFKMVWYTAAHSMGLTYLSKLLFSLAYFFFSFLGLLLLIFFLVGVGCFREERRKEMRGRMIPVIASGTPVTVWKLLLIKQVLLFKVGVIWACNTHLGKQTDLSSADKHILKTSERKRLNGIPHDCKHAEWGCEYVHVHARVWAHMHTMKGLPQPERGPELQLNEKL